MKNSKVIGSPISQNSKFVNTFFEKKFGKVNEGDILVLEIKF